ncbi:MAG: hypothetical protein FJW32_17430 [Acidobacteria bacterium]|nr:hypothetical protein [Acidobacteriota bacterium]
MHTLRLLAFAAVSGVLVVAQFRGGADWTTTGNDAQRTGWVRADAKINTKTVAAGKVEFLWKKKLIAAPAGTYTLGSAVLMDRFISHRGFRSYAFVAGAGNIAVGMDSDLGLIEWQSKLVKTPAPAGTFDCPGGVASITRPTASEFSGAGGGFGGRRGGQPTSGVGEPFAGAVTLKQAPQPRPGRPGGPGFVRRAVVLHMLASDGTFHTGYVSNGEEPKPGVPFLPANASATGFSLIDEVGYAVTGRGCGNVPDGLWALTLENGNVSKWMPGSLIAGGLAAFGGDGVVYVATAAGEIAALAPTTLAPKQSYKAAVPFTSAPVVFQHKSKTFVAAASKDGSVQIFDTALTPVARGTGSDAVTGLSTWTEAGGAVRWIAGSTGKNIVAWKVADQNGVPAVSAGWTSREMVTPATPIVVNNVVFALATGEKRGRDARTTAAQSTPAVLYALDASTGKDIWSSGKSITSFSGSGGLSSGGSQLYVQTYDGTLYAFGVAIEK